MFEPNNRLRDPQRYFKDVIDIRMLTAFRDLQFFHFTANSWKSIWRIPLDR